MRKESEDAGWIVYDPNSKDGFHKVAEINALLEFVQRSIGRLIGIYADSSSYNPKIQHPGSFIENGGLLALCFSSNANAMLECLTDVNEPSATALNGILLRDTGGVPAWMIGRSNANKGVQTYTKLLLDAFARRYPKDYKNRLARSAEDIPADQYQGTPKESILKNLTAELDTIANSKTAPNKGAPKLFPFSTCEAITTASRTAAKSKYFTQALQDRLKSTSEETDVLSYCQTCFQKGSIIKKRLIEFSSLESLHLMHYTLQYYAHMTQRPIFSVHSPEDLICSSPFVKRVDLRGIIQKGPGGPLHDFLEANRAGQSAVLIINYDAFAIDDIVRFNTLLDTQRRVDGTCLPEDMIVLGLINLSKPDCYQGSDFYSRFDKAGPLPPITLKAIPALPIQEASLPPMLEDTVVINLYNGADWQERLLGRWVLNNNALMFQSGELEAALLSGKPIEIHNGPWTNKEFERFWQEGLLFGRVGEPGHFLTIPPNLTLIRREGYDWNALGRVIQYNDSPAVRFVVNPSRYGDLIGQYQCVESSQSLVYQPGLIERHARGRLDLHVTRALHDDTWAMILDLSRHFNVTLDIRLAPGVKMPDGLNAPIHPITQEHPLCDFQSTDPTQVIFSQDADTTIVHLNREKALVIDVSECSPADLLTSIEAHFNQDTLTFTFQTAQHALLAALENQQCVVLKGRYSEELVDELAPVLLARQSQPTPMGCLIIIHSEQDGFHYFPNVVHQIDAETRYNALGELSEREHAEVIQRVHLESLSQLKARLRFLRANPDASTSDLAWEGLRTLKSAMPPFHFCPEESQIITKKFDDNRLAMLKNALSQAPFVFVAGLSGVGKTTFINRNFSAANGIQLYQGVDQIQQWACDTTSQHPVLFLDEANLNHCEWSAFEGLFSATPSILIHGAISNLTPAHRVIFSGNPVSYGDERQLAPFFARHGQSLVFDPLPPEVIFEQILKPVFDNRGISDQDLIGCCRIFLSTYHFLCERSTTDVLISPREIQMMALLTLNNHERFPDMPLISLAEHYAYQIAYPIVPTSHASQFQMRFKPGSLPSRAIEITPAFTLTPSRQDVGVLIDDLLALRASRALQKKGNDAQLYGGLGGIILEGDPGVGKSEMVLSMLIARGYQEVHPSTPSASSLDKLFYRIPVTLDNREALLLKAFHEGAVVIIDEINSSPMMEQLLNSLLMGYTLDHTPPERPGFMVIGTQNPITMGGRRATSTALSRRMITLRLERYPLREMAALLKQQGLSEEDSVLLSRCYHDGPKQSTFRDIQTIAQEWRLKTAISSSAQASNVVAAVSSYEDELLQLNQIIEHIPANDKHEFRKKIETVRDAVIACHLDKNMSLLTLTSTLRLTRELITSSTPEQLEERAKAYQEHATRNYPADTPSRMLGIALLTLGAACIALAALSLTLGLSGIALGCGIVSAISLGVGYGMFTHQRDKPIANAMRTALLSG